MSEQDSWTLVQRRKEEEDGAIQMALEGRWEEAEQVNRRILEREPSNADALNRLGKALMELRRYSEAEEAYAKVLELDPHNRIARKNRERMGALVATAKAEAAKGMSEPPGREQILPDLFISESGKSAVVPLHGVAAPRVLHQLSRGEIVRLEAQEQGVVVKTEDGIFLGRLDPRIGRRLAEFIHIGNRYAAAVAEFDDTSVKVFVRETHQHPRLAGRLSFPPVGAAQAETVRPYIRDLGYHLQAAFEAGLDEEEEEVEETAEEEEEAGGEEEELGFEEEETEEFIEEEEGEEASEETFGEDLNEEI